MTVMTEMINGINTTLEISIIFLSCAILGIIIYVTSLSIIHVFILLNKVKSNQNTTNFVPQVSMDTRVLTVEEHEDIDFIG